MTKRKENPQKAGRKTLFRKEYIEQAYKLALLGATDKQLADFFSVKEQTINNWKKDFPEFFESLKRAKEDVDSQIVKSLFQRAKGYEHDDIDIKMFNGEIIETPLTKHYPPDTTACIFWLKNRQPDKWRDKTETAVTATNLNIEAPNVDKAKELKKLLDED